jgi:FkbM family methyltransferase
MLKNESHFYKLKYKNVFNRYNVLKKLLTITKKNNTKIIFDVGSCEGQTVKEFNKHLGAFKFNFHCFEPNKDLIPELLKLKKKNNLLINNYALGDKKKKIKIFINKNIFLSSIHRVNFNSKFFINKNVLNKNITKPKIIFQDKLDNYCTKNKILKIDILKIDTQNNDLNVLRGAKNILKNTDIIIFEINFWDFYKTKKDSIYDFEKILRKNFIFFDIPFIYKNPKFFSTDYMDMIYINKKLIKFLN